MDVSFTFLHRVEEVELNIGDHRWQSALALALTLPDICGGIAFPELVKRYRDGRPMLDKQKNPTRDVGAQYIRWYDEFAASYFKLHPKDETPYICGERCWQLRCEYLHQNKGFVNEEDNDQVRFHLGVNCGTSLCRMNSPEIQDDDRDIRIDIEQFCLRMCRAARAYYEAVHAEKDFSLYNTPVLDFVQSKLPVHTGRSIAVSSSDMEYAEGIRLALKDSPVPAMVWDSTAETGWEKGRPKPILWILTEELLEAPVQPWRSDKNTPVIVLKQRAVKKKKESSDGKGSSRKKEILQKAPGRLSVLSFPLDLQELRNTVGKYL